MRRGWRIARRVVQLVAAAALLSPLAGLTWFVGTYAASFLGKTLHLADPFATLEVGVLPLAVAALPVVVLNVLLGRVFCGWLCPLGFLLEGVAWLRRELGWKDRVLPNWARWPVLAALLVGSLALGQPLFERFGPQPNLYRLLLFGFSWEALVLAAVALADLLVARRLWCRALCPAGATYGLMARAGALRVNLDPDRCGRCGECMAVCPQGRFVLADAVGRRPLVAAGSGGRAAMQADAGGRPALQAEPGGRPALVADPGACMACGECLDVCPERALAFRWDPQPDPGRRQAILTVGGLFAAAAGASMWAPRPSQERLVLRPPGALPEPEFLAQCIRCGTCAEVCPLKAIQTVNGLPHIEPRRTACDMCKKCTDACPTGALTLKPDERIQMGTAEVDHSICLAWNGTLCRACYVNCPLQGKALILDQGDSQVWRPVVNADVCTGCGMCEKHCPQEPAAISVAPHNPV